MLHDGIRISGHQRSEESIELLKKHLITLADDGDEDALIVRFNELLIRINGLESMVQSNWNSFMRYAEELK